MNKINNVALPVMITGLGLGSPLQFLPQLSWLVVQPSPTDGGLCNRALKFSAPSPPAFFSFFFYPKFNEMKYLGNNQFMLLYLRKKMMLLPDELMKTEVTIKASPWNISSWSRSILPASSCHWVEAGREAEKGDLTSQAEPVNLLFPLSHLRGGDGWLASEHSLSSPVFLVRTLISRSFC